jgi:hypothetical protein
MKGVFPWLARWTCCAGTRDFCPAWLLWLAQYKILQYFFTAHCFTSFVPNAQQASQAVMSRRLSLNMCLWLSPFISFGPEKWSFFISLWSMHPRGIIEVILYIYSRGLQRDVVYLGWPIAPSYMSPNA